MRTCSANLPGDSSLNATVTCWRSDEFVPCRLVADKWMNGFGLAGADHKSFAVLRATAKSIAVHRTTESYRPAYGTGGAGFYPADWNGGNVWEEKGSMANMMHVSGSSVCFIVAAAYNSTPR